MVSQSPRKLVAILHVDVVGFSRLTGADEDATVRSVRGVFDRLREQVGQAGGRVINVAGDSALATFESGSDALLCALRIQDQLANSNALLPEGRRVRLRMGLNLGDVIETGRGDVYGDGVNVAARLQALAEPGGVCVSESIRSVVGKPLPVAFEFIGERGLKNIAEPVRVYRVSGMAGADLPAPRPRPTKVWSGRMASIALVALLVVATVIWGLKGEHDEAPQPVASAPATATAPPATKVPGRASVAVLPLHNLGDAKDQAYFADGMTDDLITDLTKLSGLLVIARDSVYQYRDRQVDARAVGKALQVRYIVHGSVRRAGDRVRINVQLTDANQGTQLWAERYDGQLKDIFALQDRVVGEITKALSVRLTDAERRRLLRQDTKVVAAYDLYLRAREAFYRHSLPSNRRAREMLRQAIALDPKFGRAYALLARTHWFDFANAWTETPEPDLVEAEKFARQALALDETLPLAHFVLGLVHRERRQYLEALAEAEAAISYDPSYAHGKVLLASILYYTGKAEQGLKIMQEAIRLNPHHPHNYPYHLGQAHFILKDYAKAIEIFKHGLEQNPTSQRLRLWLASAYAQAGRMDDAQWELDQVRMADPAFSLQKVRKAYPFRYHQDLENFMDGLRKIVAAE